MTESDLAELEDEERRAVVIYRSCVPEILNWIDIIQADKNNPAAMMYLNEKGAYLLLRELHPKKVK